METILEYLPLMIAVTVIVIACAILASRTKLSLVFTLIQGAAVLFTFCFLMWAGAALEELLLMLAVLLTPCLLFNVRGGGNKE